MSPSDTSPPPEGRGAAVTQLLRVRLLVAPAQKPARADLKKALDPFFQHRGTATEWNALFDEALAALIASGHVTAKPLDLTETGRRAALDFLGLESLPPRADWRMLKSKYLLAKALDIPAAEARDRLSKPDQLHALVLKKCHGLPLSERPTPTAAMDALAWKQLGVSSAQKFTSKAVLIHCLGLGEKLDAKQVPARLATQAAGARNNSVDELRLALVRRWLDAAPVPQPSAAPAPVSVAFDLPGFARAALDAARSSPTGRFGEHKVFINHVWRQFQAGGALPAMTEADFKQRLIEANRDGLLTLSRADFVEVMDRGDLAASETNYLNATFHFLQT